MNLSIPVQKVFDALKSKGYDPKETDTGLVSCCPAHDDRNPSLNIKAGKDGRALLKCHAGCFVEAIVESIGLSMRDLYTNGTSSEGSSRLSSIENAQSDSGSADRGSKPKGKGFETPEDAIAIYTRSMGEQDAQWDYHIAEGKLVGIVLRWDTDSGKKIRPVSIIDGRWHNEGMPEPRPLYRLPRLLESVGPIIVCEGEKATDAAIACGYTATTSPHGSKSASKADWSVLRGRDVIIIPDLDDAGLAYADDVLTLCKGAASIRIIDLSEVWPDLDKGGDLADVLAIEAGDTEAVRSKLNAFIEQTQSELPMENSERTARNYQPFPVELLPEPIRSYVDQGAKAIGCDPSYIALPILSMLAGAIGNTHEIKLKHSWREPCIVWSCIIGSSGTSKSPALERAVRPLREIQRRLYADRQRELDAARCTMEEDRDDNQVKRSARCVIDDATIEATLEVMSENPRRMLLCRDELAGWFDFGKYSTNKSGLNSAQWLELFGGKPIHIDRRTKNPIHIPRASLSITGGIQPGILRRVLNDTFLENGLAARMLFAMPPKRPKQWTDHDVNPNVEQAMQNLIDRLYQHTMNIADPDAGTENPQPHTIGLLPDAAAIFQQFYNEHNTSLQYEEEHIAAAWVKLECYAARLALIIHLVREAAGDPDLEDPERVDALSMRIAIQLVEWFKHESKRVYKVLAMDENEQENQRAIEWISRQGGEVTVREFSRGLAQYSSSGKAQQKLNELEGEGFGYFRGRKPRGKTQEFVLQNEYQSVSDTTGTATSRPQSPNKS